MSLIAKTKYQGCIFHFYITNHKSFTEEHNFGPRAIIGAKGQNIKSRDKKIKGQKNWAKGHIFVPQTPDTPAQLIAVLIQ